MQVDIRKLVNNATVLFPQLALLLNQFKSHATSGQAAPSGQTVPATLSPASIKGNIDNQVMAAHQQLQPSTCWGWIGKVAEAGLAEFAGVTAGCRWAAELQKQ